MIATVVIKPQSGSIVEDRIGTVRLKIQVLTRSRFAPSWCGGQILAEWSELPMPGTTLTRPARASQNVAYSSTPSAAVCTSSAVLSNARPSP